MFMCVDCWKELDEGEVYDYNGSAICKSCLSKYADQGEWMNLKLYKVTVVYRYVYYIPTDTEDNALKEALFFNWNDTYKGRPEVTIEEVPAEVAP